MHVGSEWGNILVILQTARNKLCAEPIRVPTFMKATVLSALLLATALNAADLPTVTVEHLYYLQARAERIRRLKPEEMIEYCIAQKIGGSAFENLYSQLFNMRIDLTKLLKVEEVLLTDPRVVTLNKTSDAYSTLFRDEARKVQNGIVHEGQVATDTLTAIARAQNPR